MSTLPSCLFTGCSYTEGIGLSLTKTDPGLWCNILHQHPALKELIVINSGKNSATNEEIFSQSVEDLIKFLPKYAFVCWTEHLRLKINPGIETYPTRIFMSTNSSIDTDIKLNNVTYSIDYITSIKNRVFALENLHYKFLEILNYCRKLTHLAELVGTKLYFINGICEWDQNYFNHISLPNRTPDMLTPLTQSLLHVKNRDDEEIFKIYDQMHQEYKETQGLTNWINLYDGYRSKFYLDVGDDNLHPGYKSNKKFAEFLSAQFKY